MTSSRRAGPPSLPGEKSFSTPRRTEASEHPRSVTSNNQPRVTRRTEVAQKAALQVKGRTYFLILDKLSWGSTHASRQTSSEIVPGSVNKD